MKNVTLHENDIKNLNEFLNRVPLKGKNEAIALVSISNAVAQAKPVDDTPKKLKRKTEKDGE